MQIFAINEPSAAVTPHTPPLPASTRQLYPHTYASIPCNTGTYQCLLFGWRLFVCVLFFLLRDNWAAMTAAFPPNGRGQINLPVLMSVNGTGPLLQPPRSTNLLRVPAWEWASGCVADVKRCRIWWWPWCSFFDSEIYIHLKIFINSCCDGLQETNICFVLTFFWWFSFMVSLTRIDRVLVFSFWR